jgi:hypothetical protein
MSQNQLRVTRTSEIELSQTNHQDHMITTDRLTLGTMLEKLRLSPTIRGILCRPIGICLVCTVFFIPLPPHCLQQQGQKQMHLQLPLTAPRLLRRRRGSRSWPAASRRTEGEGRRSRRGTAAAPRSRTAGHEPCCRRQIDAMRREDRGAGRGKLDPSASARERPPRPPDRRGVSAPCTIVVVCESPRPTTAISLHFGLLAVVAPVGSRIPTRGG